MSYGVVRVQKMTSGSVKGIEIHDKRKKDVSHTNSDIDWSKSQNNYDLHTDQNSNFNQAVKKRIDSLELSRAVRKDAVVMAQVLVTSDKAFFDGMSEHQQKEFFKDSYDFLAKRYGLENIVSAVVHLDERTPHMHFNFVPVTEDKRLSAKSVLTKSALTEQQTAFYNQVGIKYGLERGVQGGKKKHLEIAELKKQTAYGEIEQLESKIKALTEQLESLKGVELPISNINAINPQKTLTGAIKGITLEDIENLKKTAVQGAEWKEKATEVYSAYKNVKENLDVLIKENKKRPTQIDLYQEKSQRMDAQTQLIKAQNETDKLIDRVNTVLEQLPPDTAKQFMEKWQAEKQLEKGLQRGGMER